MRAEATKDARAPADTLLDAVAGPSVDAGRGVNSAAERQAEEAANAEAWKGALVGDFVEYQVHFPAKGPHGAVAKARLRLEIIQRQEDSVWVLVSVAGRHAKWPHVAGIVVPFTVKGHATSDDQGTMPGLPPMKRLDADEVRIGGKGLTRRCDATDPDQSGEPVKLCRTTSPRPFYFLGGLLAFDRGRGTQQESVTAVAFGTGKLMEKDRPAPPGTPMYLATPTTQFARYRVTREETPATEEADAGTSEEASLTLVHLEASQGRLREWHEALTEVAANEESTAELLKLDDRRFRETGEVSVKPGHSLLDVMELLARDDYAREWSQVIATHPANGPHVTLGSRRVATRVVKSRDEKHGIESTLGYALDPATRDLLVIPFPDRFDVLTRTDVTRDPKTHKVRSTMQWRLVGF